MDFKKEINRGTGTENRFQMMYASRMVPFMSLTYVLLGIQELIKTTVNSKTVYVLKLQGVVGFKTNTLYIYM